MWRGKGGGVGVGLGVGVGIATGRTMSLGERGEVGRRVEIRVGDGGALEVGLGV